MDDESNEWTGLQQTKRFQIKGKKRKPSQAATYLVARWQSHWSGTRVGSLILVKQVNLPHLKQDTRVELFRAASSWKRRNCQCRYRGDGIHSEAFNRLEMERCLVLASPTARSGLWINWYLREGPQEAEKKERLLV